MQKNNNNKNNKTTEIYLKMKYLYDTYKCKQRRRMCKGLKKNTHTQYNTIQL